jgi:protein-tyrosine-phosphatase
VSVLESKLLETRTKYTKEIESINHEHTIRIAALERKHREQIKNLEIWYKKNEDWIVEENKKEFEKGLKDPSYTGNKLDQYIDSFTDQESDE